MESRGQRWDREGGRSVGRELGSSAAVELPAQPRIQAFVRAVTEDVHLDTLPEPNRQMTGPLIDDGQVLLQLWVPDEA